MAEYISKQSIIDYLNGYLHSIGEGGADSLLFDRGQRRALINSIQDISAVEAADVQPVKRGRWIHDRGGYDGRDNWYHCSECNRTLNLICGKKLENYPYCHCGARMDGDTE